MRNHSFLAVLALAAVGGLFLAGCSGNSTSPRFGTMNVRMTDDPGNFDHVNLVVTQVSTRMEDADTTETDSTEGGWIVLKNTAATYDLIAKENTALFVTVPATLTRRMKVTRPAASGSFSFGLRPWFGLRAVECWKFVSDLASQRCTPLFVPRAKPEPGA